MDAKISKNINLWLEGNYDEETKKTILELQKNNPSELADAFYTNLEFGTGGLRGIMGVGTNRINKYTIGYATQGLANYLIKKCINKPIKVAIAHDSRNNSRFFAETTAKVFAGNGFQVYLFESLRPTPELSFAIRHLKCDSGVVCTASHNPKEYNGYKAYWNDGGQLVPPHDSLVIDEVNAIKSIDEVKWTGGEQNIHIIGSDLDNAYLEMAANLSVYPEIIKSQNDLKIVYTPIHGSGIKLVPALLQKIGFTNIHIVPEQAEPDGNFPTVGYPNPEEAETMSLGLKKAKSIDADILLGTDPDADRVGIGVKNTQGEWILLNGNQTAVLAISYLIEARKLKGIAEANDMIIKTIVTTQLINKIAKKNNIKCYDVLTGFKWIAELIKEKEGKENFIIGGEESFGMLIGDKLRDKDAVSAVALLCEMAAFEKSHGRSLYEKLLSIYQEYGLYYENLISITKKGMDGQTEIKKMMDRLRENPPKTIAGQNLSKIYDYQKQIGYDYTTNKNFSIELPKSNVLQFETVDGTLISARPSGTEPKIKFYFSVNCPLKNNSDEESELIIKELQDKIQNIIIELKLKD